MEAKIIWQQDMQFKAISGSGHSTTIDGSAEFGGKDTGMRPMEMLLLSMAGCSAMDVIFILKKYRQDVTNCIININGERAESIPKVFTSIHVHYEITGNNLNEQKVMNAVSLSADKYCSVAEMMRQSCKVTHSYSVK